VPVRSDFLNLVSPDQVAAEMESGSLIRIKSVIPDSERVIGTITRRDWYPTPLQESFMKLLKLNAPRKG